MERQTIQKDFILEYLRKTKTHPTAEEVFKEVRKKIPRISLGTVYRNLHNFSKKKIIKEIYGEKKHYDADLFPHHHLICQKCHCIFDIKKLNINTCKLKKNNQMIGNLENCTVFIYGICKKCK